jgi:hypothetical protein
MAEPGLAGLTRTPTCFMAGTISRNNSTSLPLRSGLIGVTPVTFLPGRARLATNPVPTRSEILTPTMGIVEVAFPAAIRAGVDHATMTSTLARTSSATTPEFCSNGPGGHRTWMDRF